MKKKVIILSSLIVFAIVITVLILINNEDNSMIDEYYLGECLYKGYTCYDEDIYDGILLNIAVNDEEKYDFYMISNDEDTMTLMMGNNLIDDINWNDRLINIEGPYVALLSLSISTENWDLIPEISYYKYEDYGKKSYLNICNSDKKPKEYECFDGDSDVGYDYVEIISGKGYVKNNDPYKIITDSDGFNVEMNTRMITYEEIMDLYSINNEYPEWLIHNLKKDEGYWTMSSSADMKTGYVQGAWAIINEDGKASLDSRMVYDVSKEIIGVRPVITIFKEEK